MFYQIIKDGNLVYQTVGDAHLIVMPWIQTVAMEQIDED
jgi:hypothetical protein